MVCFSCGKSGYAATRCPNLDESFPFMQPGWRAEKTPGGFIMIPPRVAMNRRRVENRVSTVWTEETPGRECPHDDFEMRLQMGTTKMSDDSVPDTNIKSPYGGLASSLSGVTGSSCPVDFPVAPVDGHKLGSWQVAVVRVDGTPAGDTSGRKCSRAEQNRRRPSDVSKLHGGPGSLCGGREMLTSPEVTGSVILVVPAGGPPLAGAVNPAGPDGPVVAGGPVGPCEMPSPSFYGNLDPLEHSVQDYAGPDDWHVAVGPSRTLSSSDCHPAGPAARMLQGALLAQMFCLKFWSR